ncbi:MAG: LysR substrate-binding domain-containing protein [Micrococcaceae bacterium]
MEVHQAEAFLVLAEELHFGRAAARLRMAQPPLSRLIKQLERELGSPLFERTTRSVTLTTAGEALVRPAQGLLRAAENARQVVLNAVTGETGHVDIGFAGASTQSFVGSLAREVRKNHQGINLEFHSSQFSHTGLQRVLDGSLDLAIGRWDFVPAEVDSHLLTVEEALVVVPSGHPLANGSTVRMKDLARDPWVTLPSGFGAALQNRLNSLSMAAGFTPRVVQTAPDSWTLLVLVAAGMGSAITLDSVRDNAPTEGVSFLNIRGGNTALELRLIWRKTNSNPALPRVLQAARKLYPLEDAAPGETPAPSSP